MEAAPQVSYKDFSYAQVPDYVFCVFSQCNEKYKFQSLFFSP